MVTIINTGDRESDLYHWEKVKHKAIYRFDGEVEQHYNQFLGLVNSIPLFSDQTPIAIHKLSLEKLDLHTIAAHNSDVFIISPIGKLPKKLDTSKFNFITEKVSETALKASIDKALTNNKIALDRFELLKLYTSISATDTFGKEHLSPLLVTTFLRRIAAIVAASDGDSSVVVKELISFTEEGVSQWDLLKKLFSVDKKAQHRYFEMLSDKMSTFEILNMTKTTLLLLITILTGRELRLDSTTIASKLKKNPYYISSLLKTATESGIILQKAKRLLTRVFNLELAIKSGKFDDEAFGFEVLMATLE